MSLPPVTREPAHTPNDDSGSANAGLERGTASDGYRVFDVHAAEYDSWFTEHATIFEAEVEAVRRMVPSTGVGVEIGVGTGRFAVPLDITIGVEPAWHMAVIAKARGVAVCLALGEELPFRDGAVDFGPAVISSMPSSIETARSGRRMRRARPRTPSIDTHTSIPHLK